MRLTTYNGVFHSNAAELYSWAKAIVSFLGRGEQRGGSGSGRGGGGGGEGDQNSNAAMQHSLLMGLGYRVYAHISDDASDSIENDMGSRHKSWEWLVWSP